MKIFINNKKIYSIYSAILTVLLLILIFSFDHVLGYNNNTILTGDLFCQYIDFIQAFIRVLRADGSFWYTFSIYLGSGNILNNAYYCLNPFNLFYLIESINIPTMTLIIIILKLSLAAFNFNIFEIYGLKLRSKFTVIFSTFYALSGFFITMYFNMIWLDAFYMLPLIILAVFKLVDKGKFISLIFLYAYLFITNFYMGYMVGIFSFLVFVLYFFYKKKILINKFSKEDLIIIFKFIFSVILAAGLCAIVLLPAAYFLFSHLATDNFSFEALKVNILDLINSMFAGQMQTIDTKIPMLYCGIPALFLIPYFFYNKKNSIRIKIYVFIPILFLLISCEYLPLYKFMHCFDYPNYYGFRFVFLLVFIFTSLSAVEFEKIKSEDINLKVLYIYSGVLLVIYLLEMKLQPYSLDSSCIFNSIPVFCVNLFFIAAYLFCCIWIKYKKNIKVSYVIFVIAAMAELITNGCICHYNTGYGVDESLYNQWYYSEKEAIDLIKEKDDSFYRITVNGDRSSNSASLFGYNGISTFSSSDDYNLRTLLSGLGLGTGNRFVNETGLTDLTKMLLGVKYVVNLTDSDDLDYNVTKDNYISATISENNLSLGLGYMVSPYIEDFELTDDVFLNQELLVDYMTADIYNFWEKIYDDDIVVDCNNMDYTVSDNGIYYSVDEEDADADSYISYNILHDDDKKAYACFRNDISGSYSESPYLLGEMQGIREQQKMSYGAIIPMLQDREIDGVILYFPQKINYSVKQLYFYRFNNSELETLFEDLKKGEFNVTLNNYDYIEGNVNVTKDRPVMFLSIPYDESWHAYVDGKEVQIYPLLNDAFCGLVLEEGYHNISLKYVAKYSYEGAIISFAALIVFCFTIIGTVILKKEKK